MKANKEVILPLSDIEIKGLLDIYDNSSLLNSRNKSIIMLMLDCGLRLGEVVSLQLNDIDFVNHCLVVNGKGSKQRVVPFGSALSKQLLTYFDYRNSVSSASSCVFLTKKNTVMNRTIHKFKLPEGMWYEFTTGKKYVGNKDYNKLCNSVCNVFSLQAPLFNDGKK